MAKSEIQNPIISSDAQEEFGVGRKWLKARIKSGEIRSERVGRYLILERSDVARLAPNVDLLQRALEYREKGKGSAKRSQEKEK